MNKLVKAALPWWLPPIMLLALIGCSDRGSGQSNDTRGGARNMDETLFCTGRFSFLSPAGFRETGRNQEIYRTSIKTIPMPEAGVDRYWRERLTRIQGGASQRPAEVLPGSRAVWSARNEALPQVVTLELVKPTASGLHLISVEVEAGAGKEKIAEGLVRDIVESYASATERGFCIGNGALTIEPSQNEQARLAVGKAGVSLQFQSRTVAEPDLRTHMDVEEESGVARAAGGSLEVLADRERSSAALEGREIRILMSIPGSKPELRFTWHYPGESRNAKRPSIDVMGTAEASRKADLEAAWELLLTSLRATPVPAAAGR